MKAIGQQIYTRKFAVWFREKIVANTDPQRRCYNRCNFSEEKIWTKWGYVATYKDKAIAEDSARVFKDINPGREYKIVEELA